MLLFFFQVHGQSVRESLAWQMGSFGDSPSAVGMTSHDPAHLKTGSALPATTPLMQP